MDISMVMGGMLLAMLDGLSNDGSRARVLDMLAYFAKQQESFSPAERHIFQTMVDAANETLSRTRASSSHIPPPPTRSRHLRLVGGAA